MPIVENTLNRNTGVENIARMNVRKMLIENRPRIKSDENSKRIILVVFTSIYIRFQLIYVLIVIRKDVDFTMTRQERRRLERNKNTTYNMSASQLASIAAQGEKEAFRIMRDGLNQELKEEAKEATLKAFQQTFYIPLLVLRNLGWGKVRLKRFAENMIDQMEMFEENYFNSNDVREMIKEETGLNLSFELDHKNKRSTIKVVSE